ncbi:MAG TPA: hypothetical protein VJ729_12880 [Nitrososphaeraceae archaeon]|nr:hypothetical protein [Nitrososphaeraceae archaeon]
MSSEYVVIGPRPWEARILAGDKVDGEEIAEIKKGEDQKSFKLVRKKDGHEWTLTKKVHGEFRPFSISVLDEDKNSDIVNKEILTVREHLFKYRDRFYMLTNHPEGKHWNEYLSGSRYISRLDNFPYSDLTDLDRHIKHKLRRYRGVPVGEASGLGIDGHHVKVEKELEDIGLLIAASSYLIYSTA